MNQQYVIKPTNCREGQFKQTTTSEMDASDLEIGDQQIIIPMNAAIRIFYFVSRDDLENCKLVCRSWKTLIDYADKELPKRKIDALLLSTAREYSMGIYHGNVKKCFFYRKYFIDRDIDEIEITKDESEYFDSTKFRFPCGTPYPRIRTNMVFEIPDNFHHETCKSVRPIIYRHNRNYSKKLFTPPLAYYERLKKMLYRSEIQKLIFHGFTFTNLFVEKIFEYIKEPLLKIEQVVLHGCNLRYLTPQTFHLLLDGFHADAYYIEKSRFCLPDHISPPLFEKSSILLAKIIYIDYAIERNTGTAVTFPIDDEFILKLAKMLLNVGRIEREFFGVALSRVTQKIIKPYEQLALQSNAQFQNNGQFMMMKENDNRAEEHLNLRWLYKILLFGEIRCNLSNWQI